MARRNTTEEAFNELLNDAEKAFNEIPRGPRGDLPFIYQNLSELQAFYQPGRQGTAAEDGAPSAEALGLLAQQKVNTEEFNSIRHMDLDANFDPVELFEVTDVDGHLLHHHDLILYSAVEEANRAAEEETMR